MIKIQKCRPTQIYECVYVTKDNIYDFVELLPKYAEDDNWSVKKINTIDNYAEVSYRKYSFLIYINKYYVKDCYGFLQWTGYTKENFIKEQQLIDEE